MRIDPQEFAQHYASMSDEQLLDINPAELSEIARPIYQAEIDKRGLAQQEDQVVEEVTDLIYEGEDPEHAPDWLDNAAVACAFPTRSPDADEPASNAHGALEAAGIPCHVVLIKEDPQRPGAQPHYEFRVLVPGALLWHATSVLDRDLFNQDQDEEFRAFLAGLDEEEFQMIDPNLICAGLQNRIDRLRQAYADERAQRGV